MEIEEARAWVHGYQAKLGKNKNPHPPDDTIIVQIITAADGLQRLTGLMKTLFNEMKAPGDEYSWYVSVALQRIHGIQPEVLKAARQQLRIARPPRPAAITGQQEIRDGHTWNVTSWGYATRACYFGHPCSCQPAAAQPAPTPITAAKPARRPGLGRRRDGQLVGGQGLADPAPVANTAA